MELYLGETFKKIIFFGNFYELAYVEPKKKYPQL